MWKKRKGNLVFAYDTARVFMAATQPLVSVYVFFQTSRIGLRAEEVERRRAVFGRNEVEHEKKKNPFSTFIKAFINPFIGVLTVLVVVSFILDVLTADPGEQDWTAIIIISVMVVSSSILKFRQEWKAGASSESLLRMVTNTCYVRRVGNHDEEIDIADLVPGDIVMIAAGDMIPADMRIIEAKDLFVSQTSLTGESDPIEKHPHALKGMTADKSLAELDNICFLGSNVVSGSATGIVFATGNDTYMGSIAKGITGHRAATAFDKGISRVSFLLIRFMLVMIPFVFLVNGFTKGDWLEAFLFAVSVAVGLTPEMLPMIVTANLSKGAVAMSRKKTIVKDLNAIQNFGAMDILCTDKTGTLTCDQIVLEKYINADGSDDDDKRILRHAYFNSFFQTGLKNLMDKAICSHAEYKGAVHPLTPELRARALEISVRMNRQGMRVLAVAHKSYLSKDRDFSVADESGMVLIGYLAFLDPPKPSAASAIRRLHEHGIEVKILSGDNDAVVQTIARQVGIDTSCAVSGPELERMDAAELRKAVLRTKVFARLTPDQKTLIISLLQEQNHTVGFLGDGINDAAALRQSDIGISVDSAVDIAKESADIILLEKNLMVLEDGVLEGRRTFGNITKYIKMTASSNFGNMFSVMAASAFLPFLPMLPIHLLIQNLLYDISQTAIPFDRMDADYLRRPRKWDASDLSRFMIFIGPISSVFDIATYLVMWHVFGCDSSVHQSLFQSGWFVEGLLSQTLIVHMIRTRRIPFVQSRASWQVSMMALLTVTAGILIPFTPLGGAIGLEPLPLAYFPWLFGILLSYCMLTQIVKNWYIRRFVKWL